MDLKNYLSTLIELNLQSAVDIRKKNKVGSSSVESYSFIISALKILYPGISVNDLEKSITDNDKDEQIDAIVINKKFVDIYDFKTSEGFRENDIRLFKDSVDKLIFNSSADLSKCDVLVKNRIIEAREAIDEDNLEVRLRVVRGGDNSNYPQGLNALKELKYNSISETSLLSLRDLITIELKLNVSPIKYDWNIKVKKNSASEDSTKIKILESTKINSLICRLDLKTLVDLFHNFQPNPEVIFEANVRGLQNNKKISDQILASLSSTTKAKSFYKLHNGLTIVCDEISERSLTKYIIKNPQIVNGCQTVTTISNFYKSNREAKVLEYGSVICKIFAADKTEVENICLASNSQVAIGASDLRTNDNVQILIESYLNKKGFKYDRKATRISKNNFLTFKDLGQWLCSSLIYKPAFAKNSKSKIFMNINGGIYDQIFIDKIDLEKVKKIVDYGIYVRDKINSIPTKNRTFEIPANLHFLAALYYLDSNGWSKDYSFSKINLKIKTVITKMKKKNGDEITYPKIFTQHEETWKELKNLLDKDLLKKKK